MYVPEARVFHQGVGSRRGGQGERSSFPLARTRVTPCQQPKRKNTEAKHNIPNDEQLLEHRERKVFQIVTLGPVNLGL